MNRYHFIEQVAITEPVQVLTCLCPKCPKRQLLCMAYAAHYCRILM